MRVLCTTHPGSGHLHTLVPLARGLEAAGHEVKVASAGSFRPSIEATGLAAVPAGVDWLQSESEVTVPGFRDGERARQVDMLARLALRGMVNDLIRIGRGWRPDVIVRDATEYAGWVAAEYLGIPHAAYGVGIRVSAATTKMWTSTVLSTLPCAYGLPPDPTLGRMFRHLYVNPVPESFEPTPADVMTALFKSVGTVGGLTPARFVSAIRRASITPEESRASVRIQPTSFDRSSPGGVPDRVRELPAQPTVYATLGTVYNQQPHLFELILAAFRDVPANLILTVGRNVDPGRFGPQPPNVLIERYVPQSAILPRCEAVISHGGYTTLMAAFRHGLPVCCLPLGADQPLNTRRAVRLGAGLSCANTARSSSPFPTVDSERLEPGAVREAVWRLLTEPRFRHAAEGVRREIESLPGVDVAVAGIERLVGARAGTAAA